MSDKGLSWFKARAFESSTWRGIGGLVVALGLASAGSVDAVIAAGAAIMALVEVVRPGA